MFEQVLSAPRWTIVHFVFGAVSGTGRGGVGGGEQNSHYKGTRSAGVIGIFGSVRFQGPSEPAVKRSPVRLERWQGRLPSRSPLLFHFYSRFSRHFLIFCPCLSTFWYRFLLSARLRPGPCEAHPSTHTPSCPPPSNDSSLIGQVWVTNEIN